MNKSGSAFRCAVVLSLVCSAALFGCGQEEPPAIPMTIGERNAAIDNNPKLSSDQKDAQKKFIAEQQKSKEAMMKAMGASMGGRKP